MTPNQIVELTETGSGTMVTSGLLQGWVEEILEKEYTSVLARVVVNLRDLI